MNPSDQLSPHFTLKELTFSVEAVRHGLNNDPNADQVANLMRLASTLEIARAVLGAPLHIDSGYRSAAVNHLVGSTAAHSAHLDGRAADLIPIGLSVEGSFEILRKDPDLHYDQIIIECGEWIHLAIAPVGVPLRREQLIAYGKAGDWHYRSVA